MSARGAIDLVLTSESGEMYVVVENLWERFFKSKHKTDIVERA